MSPEGLALIRSRLDGYCAYVNATARAERAERERVETIHLIPESAGYRRQFRRNVARAGGFGWRQRREGVASVAELTS